MATIDDIIKTVERFRGLAVGRSGIGKSSLINHVYGITGAHVAHFKLGEPDIQQDIESKENPFFVLHDSKGFEPGDVTNFETVHQFILERSQKEHLRDRIHGLWLCTETPTAGGRVFEAGDEKLMQFAHDIQIPIVIVFTQYDRLVRTKEDELQEDSDEILDPATLKARSEKEAGEAFDICLKSLWRTMDRLNIPLPRYVKVSVRPGYKEDISALVAITQDSVREWVRDDGPWIMWAIAQQASVPVKIDACVRMGLSYYICAFTGITPGLGQMLLRDCLVQVHKDIVTCLNFKGEEILNSTEFTQVMLCLVQDVHAGHHISTPPNVGMISDFVSLVTVASPLIVPPVAILGLTYIFLKWLSNAVLEKVPEVQRLLIAYTVDLIRVLRELFDITLQPKLALTTTWEELQRAFEAYERSASCQRAHNIICSQGELLTVDGINQKVRELLKEYLRDGDDFRIQFSK